MEPNAASNSASSPRERSEATGTSDDRQAMLSFHYSQELRRSLRLFGSFAVAFSFISITTGIFANYEMVIDRTGCAGFWTWPLVVIGQALVALVFADLAARMPLTGYSYQWVSRLAGPGWGWMTGWISVCFLIIVIPSVIRGIAGIVGHSFDMAKDAPALKMMVCGIIAVLAAIHIIGVRWADRINSAAVFTEIVGMLGLIVALAVVVSPRTPSLAILFDHGPVPANEPYWGVWMTASLMGAYTLVGFESAANLAEETVDAASTVPKAMLYSVFASGSVGLAFLMISALSIRDLNAVVASSYPLPLIIEDNLGRLTATFFFVLVAISIFACGLVIMASASRMVYAMARDDVFIGNALLRRVSPTTSVPVPAVLFVASIAIIAEIFASSLEQLLAAAAILPALIYLITVVTYAFQRHSLPVRPGHFTLGSSGQLIAALATFWLLTITTILTLPREFHEATRMSLTICGVGAALYFTVVRTKIMRGVAGVHASSQSGTASAARADSNERPAGPHEPF